MNTDKLLNMLLEVIDYSFLQTDGSYDKALTYPVIDKIQYIKEQLKDKKTKEVDLAKEITRFTMSKELYEADSVIKAVAEHFFELGLKAKGE